MRPSVHAGTGALRVGGTGAGRGHRGTATGASSGWVRPPPALSPGVGVVVPVSGAPDRAWPSAGGAGGGMLSGGLPGSQRRSKLYGSQCSDGAPVGAVPGRRCVRSRCRDRAARRRNAGRSGTGFGIVNAKLWCRPSCGQRYSCPPDANQLPGPAGRAYHARITHTTEGS